MNSSIHKTGNIYHVYITKSPLGVDINGNYCYYNNTICCQGLQSNLSCTGTPSLTNCQCIDTITGNKTSPIPYSQANSSTTTRSLFEAET